MFDHILVIFFLPFVFYIMIMLSPPMLIFKFFQWMVRREVNNYIEHD